MQFPQDKFSKRSETHTDILFFPAIQTQIKESGDRRSHSNGALSVYQTRNRYAYPTWEFQICAPQKQNEEYFSDILHNKQGNSDAGARRHGSRSVISRSDKTADKESVR